MYVAQSSKNVLHFGRDRSSAWCLLAFSDLFFVPQSCSFCLCTFCTKNTHFWRYSTSLIGKVGLFRYLIYVKAPLEEHFHYYSCSIKRKIWHRAWKSTRHCRASHQLGKIHQKERLSFEIRCKHSRNKSSQHCSIKIG